MDTQHRTQWTVDHVKADPQAFAELLNKQQACAEQASESLQEASSTAQALADRYKNLHRALCERFGYTHDEVDWARDEVSLIEHIAKSIEDAAESAPSAVASIRQERDWWRDAAEAAQGQLRFLQTKLDSHRALQRKDVWFFEGQGHDHIQSMVSDLRVVIQADQLRQLINEAAQARTSQAEATRE